MNRDDEETFGLCHNCGYEDDLFNNYCPNCESAYQKGINEVLTNLAEYVGQIGHITKENVEAWTATHRKETNE